jgi:hypothetical protein
MQFFFQTDDEGALFAVLLALGAVPETALGAGLTIVLAGCVCNFSILQPLLGEDSRVY